MTTVTRSPMGVIRDRPGDCSTMMMAAIDEAIAVGRARGVKLPADIVDEHAQDDSELPGRRRSRRCSKISSAAGRLELPWLSGAVVRIGKEVGVPTPIHQFITTILTPFVNGTK